MRVSIEVTRAGRRSVVAVAVACLSAASGCATLRATLDGYSSGPGGISRPQHRLREALVHDDFVAALAWRDDDALLQALTTATAAYYAGQFARSAALLDSAALLADDRITTSVSRTGLSLLTNDLARPYEPRRTERLFMPYYALLAFAQLGAWEDAAVEARRVLALRDQYAEDRDPGERRLHAVATHLAGAVLERAGDQEGARAAYRVAEAIDSVIAAPRRGGSHAADGELLVVVERGFVAHRVTRALQLCVGEHCEARPRRSRPGAPRASAERGDLASLIRGEPDEDTDVGVRYVTVAFPELRRSPAASVPLAVVVDESTATGLAASASVDDAVESDTRRDLMAVTARATARAVAKAGVTQVIADRKGELAGDIASAGAMLLERSDVRSWHLLPQQVSLVRLRVPAGERSVRLVVGSDPTPATVDLGTVVVKPGTLTIITRRLWSAAGPSRPAPALADADSAARRHGSMDDVP